MFKNYLKIAIRNILRHRFYSLINILGLAIGLACFIMIGLWVKDELSYDRHFKNADRIYRIANDLITSGEPSAMAAADPRIAKFLMKEYPPELHHVARMSNMPTLITNQGNTFFEPKLYFVDTTFFDVFSFKLVKGDPKTAISNKESIILTESLAKKIFGNADPMGKTIYVSNRETRDSTIPRIVTGIMQDNIQKQHFNPEALMVKYGSIDMFEYMYIRFPDGYDPKRFETEIWPRLNNEHFKEEYAGDNQALTLNLQPLTGIHLDSHLLYEAEPTGSRTNVYIFSVIGFFILLIAAINYMNLATARAYNRSREVGVRKVVGATRQQLRVQFLTESIALSLFALVLALVLVEVTLPFFNKLSEKTLAINLLDPATILIIGMLAIVVGFISGVYPAFFISSFLPIKALKGTLDTGRNKPTLRKTLVVVQFSLSIIMLIATMVVSKQLAYAKNTDLGFNKDQVMVVSLSDPAIAQKIDVIQAELKKNPGITQTAASHNVPGGDLYHFYYQFENASGAMEPRLITTMLVDYDYINLMGFKMADGTAFDKGMLQMLDTSVFMVVNESAAKMLGWQDPVGKKVWTSPLFKLRKGKCVGVVKDFHATSLHDNIPPLVFTLTKGGFNYLSIKMHSKNASATVHYVENLWKSFSHGYPFEYSFLDESFNKQYDKEDRTNTIFKWFSGLCIFISCLGLLGLASFSTRQRTKEIGIRKISGASVSDIVLLLSRDFIVLVNIAIIIAIPVAYYAMHQWLQNFAYRTDIGWLIFVMSGVLAIFIALATISFHTIRAASKNPAGVLKYE